MEIRFLPIIKKEMKSYFNTPIPYIVVIAFLVFTSVWFFFIQNFVVQNVASLRAYFGVIPIVFIILMPALTMKMWAEEKKLGTIELLLTLPFKDGIVVIGKFLSAFILLCIIMVLTFPIPITLAALGDFEVGEVVGEYIGTLLIGGAGIAIGLFVSSVSTNQITAFLFGLLTLLFFTLVSQVNFLLDLPKWLSDFVNYISLNAHYNSFRKGLVDSRDTIYFFTITVLFLYLNTKVLVFKKWK